LAIALASTCYASKLTHVQPDSGAFADVSRVARQWSDSLLKKDFEGLAAVSLPEYQDGIRKGLAREDSALYRALYQSRSSPYRKLRDLRAMSVAVFAHDDLRNLGQGTTACFFDAQNAPKWPPDSALLPAIEKRRDVYCIFLAKIDGRWVVSTDFAERQ
jgi:hypothetical protein